MSEDSNEKSEKEWDAAETGGGSGEAEEESNLLDDDVGVEESKEEEDRHSDDHDEEESLQETKEKELLESMKDGSNEEKTEEETEETTGEDQTMTDEEQLATKKQTDKTGVTTGGGDDSILGEDNASISDAHLEGQTELMTATIQLTGGTDPAGNSREMIPSKGGQGQRDDHHHLKQEDDTNKDRLRHDTRTSEPDHFEHGLGLPRSPSANIKMPSREGASGPSAIATAGDGQPVSAVAGLGSGSDGGEETSESENSEDDRLSIMAQLNSMSVSTARVQLPSNQNPNTEQSEPQQQRPNTTRSR